MSTIQTHRTTHTSPTRTTRPRVGRALAGSLGAAAAGATVLLGYGALAVAVHGPMQAGDPGAAEATPINAASFPIGVLFSSLLGVVLAMALARRAKQPARTFRRTAIVLTLVSLVAPFGATHTDDATRFLLAGGHVVAALVIIPLIVRALAPSTESHAG